MSGDPQVTELLRLSREGAATARDRVFELLQEDLKRLAAGMLRSGFRRSAVMQTTMLVNCAVERLLERGALDAANRRHLFALLARAMHDVLVEEARAHSACKRGGGRNPIDLADEVVAEQSDSTLPSPQELEDLRAALELLTELEPDSAEVVRLSFYCGRSLREISEITGQSLATTRGNLDYGRAWLHDRLGGPDAEA